MGCSAKLTPDKKRWLRKHKSTSCPSNLLFVDTETLSKTTDLETGTEHHALRLGHAISCRYEKGKSTRRETLDFTDSGDFWGFLHKRSHKRLPLWVFAHNIPFDLSILGFWGKLADREFGFAKAEIEFQPDVLTLGDKRQFRGLFIDSDPPTVIAVHNDVGAKIIFCDTLNYWRLALSTLGNSLGFPKGETPRFEESDETWMEYCRRDVEILERAVTNLMDWHREHDLGSWGFTQAQMSMNAYRHRFYDKPIELHDNPDVKKLERASYYGGRLEMHFKGRIDEPVYGLDVNSMYPALMKTHEFPRELLVSSGDFRNADLTPSDISIAHIATVEIKSRDHTFPLRTREGTLYPVGHYRTTLAGPELIRATKFGVIRSVENWSRYALWTLFADYVDFFYTVRQEAKQAGNDVDNLFCKIFMNSLYGKFGQRTPVWEDVSQETIRLSNTLFAETDYDSTAVQRFEEGLNIRLWEILDAETGLMPKLRKIGNHWQLQVERREHKNAFPAIASYVTAYGRELINHIREIAGIDNVYYVVTDAVFVNQTGYDNLDAAGWIDNSKLGKLSVVCQGDWGEFEALHHYKVGVKNVFGSRKKSAIELSPGKIRELHFEGLKSLIKRPGDGTVKIYPVVKEFRREYTRGIICDDGRIKPLVMKLND